MLPLRICLLATFVLMPQIDAATFKIGSHSFTLPEGFSIELIAGPPLVDRPIEADFDEAGNLYVTESSGTNDKVQKQLTDKPHRVLKLSDTQGNGRFDHRTLFVDKIMFPEGSMWANGSLFVSAPPSIWKFTDTKGDGIADEKTEWFQGKTLTGCANDLHGPYLGPDGWIYWCKGAFAEQRYDMPGGGSFLTKAAHIFRARSDGTRLEPVMTGGMDNPVGIVFTPEGERIFTTTFFQQPEGGHRDGLIHAIYGGVYGKKHDVLDGHIRTGDLLPVLTHLGPAAPCGIARYKSEVFGKEYQDNVFVASFNLHKITRHILRPKGSSYETTDDDFLVSDNSDFHPTDVLEDADGSLIVVDTGGWYKICCPTSQLYKPDVLGAIYRVKRLHAPPVADPRGNKVSFAQIADDLLLKFLADPRPVVVDRAIHFLAQEKKFQLLESALKHSQPRIRLNAVWALCQIDDPRARAALRLALGDSVPSVAHAAIHAVSLWKERSAAPDLVNLLRKPDPQLRRAAAEALGRIGDPATVKDLLEAAAHPADRVEEHSLIYALIEINAHDQTEKGLSGPARNAAMVALDQMKDGRLSPEAVIPLLTSHDPKSTATALWVAGHHPDWGDKLAETLKVQLHESGPAPELAGLMAAFASLPQIQDLLSAAWDNPASRPFALQVISGSKLKVLPASWTDILVRSLLSNDSRLVHDSISAARFISLTNAAHNKILTALARLSADEKMGKSTRLDALSVLPKIDPSPGLFEFLMGALDPHSSFTERTQAAALLAKGNWSEEQLAKLADQLKHFGPMELPKVLGAFAKTRDEATAAKLLASLKQNKAAASLRKETVQPLLTQFTPQTRAEFEGWLASLQTDAAAQGRRIDDLLKELNAGDVRNGQLVFNNPKVGCASCHAIGYLGGHVGPDLTRIGQIRTERDLLESIVYPSASFVRSYEPVVAVTKTGEEINGIISRDGPEEIVLVTGPQAEVRLPRSDLAELRPSQVSIMPSGLEEQLNRKELSDLLAFLKSTKW